MLTLFGLCLSPHFLSPFSFGAGWFFMVTLLGLRLSTHLPPFFFWGRLIVFMDPSFFRRKTLYRAGRERGRKNNLENPPTLQDAHQEKGGSKTYFFHFLRLLCNLAQIEKLEDAPWSKMELGAPSRAHTAHGDEGKRGAD